MAGYGRRDGVRAAWCPLNLTGWSGLHLNACFDLESVSWSSSCWNLGCGARSLGCSFLARRPLDLFPFQLIFYVLGIRHYFPCLHFFQLGKFLHQLFHAEFCKLYRNLRIVTVSLAAEDDALAIFGMAHALAAAKSCRSAGGTGISSFGRLPASSSARRKTGRCCPKNRMTAARPRAVGNRARTLVLVFVAVVPGRFPFVAAACSCNAQRMHR